MTPQQNACLIAIRDLTVDGVAPTIEEIRAHLGDASKSSVHRKIDGLIRQGFLRRRPFADRGLEVVAQYGAGIGDNRIAIMSTEALESAYARIGAALAHRRALSQGMREMAA